MTDSRTALVIGGGHNGLVCAAYLGRAGYKVTVLEAADQIGGAAVTREFAPGFRVSAAAHFLYLLDAKISSDLKLESHGLKMAAQSLGTVSLDTAGNYLHMKGDALTGPAVNDGDPAAFKAFHQRMSRFAHLLGGLHKRQPPRMGTSHRKDLIGLARLAWDIRRLGRKEMREFLRIAGINVYDILQEQFDNEALKGALSVDGVLGTALGTRSNNSVFCALHRMSQGGEYSLPQGGMGAVSDAIAAAAKAAGVDVRLNSEVARIVLEDGHARGVQLSNGETLQADCVVSGVDPKSTFLELLGARELEAGFAHRVANIRAQGHVAKLHLALNGLPTFTGLDPSLLGERLLIAPDMQYVERAFNHSKYGEYSSQPVMEISIASVHDDSLAPTGKHVLSANIQWAPRHLKQGWAAAREEFQSMAIHLLEQYAPGITNQIEHAELLTPEDIESQFRMHGGHWHHGELSLDQFMMLRPVPGAAQYRSPVDGLWLCSAGSHPGGGVMGCAGHNAARAIVQANKE